MAGEILYFLHRNFRVVAPVAIVMWMVGLVGVIKAFNIL